MKKLKGVSNFFFIVAAALSAIAIAFVGLLAAFYYAEYADTAIKISELQKTDVIELGEKFLISNLAAVAFCLIPAIVFSILAEKKGNKTVKDPVAEKSAETEPTEEIVPAEETKPADLQPIDEKTEQKPKKERTLDYNKIAFGIGVVTLLGIWISVFKGSNKKEQ